VPGKQKNEADNDAGQSSGERKEQHPQIVADVPELHIGVLSNSSYKPKR
jgi:hypothetical protein